MHEFAAQLAAGPAVALSFTKRAVQRSDELTLEASSNSRAGARRVCFKTADFAEGIAAFKEQARAPIRRPVTMTTE